MAIMRPPPEMVLSVERWIFVEAHTLRLPPRVRVTWAVLSPAVMAPLLPMMARPFSTEMEPVSDTPSSETVAMEGCGFGGLIGCADSVNTVDKDSGCCCADGCVCAGVAVV